MPTLITHMKRLFSSKPARELASRTHNSGGSWLMPESARSIRHARKLKNAALSPVLPVSRTMALLVIAALLCAVVAAVGVWLSVWKCTGTDLKDAQNCFLWAFWASCASGVISLCAVTLKFFRS